MLWGQTNTTAKEISLSHCQEMQNDEAKVEKIANVTHSRGEKKPGFHHDLVQHNNHEPQNGAKKVSKRRQVANDDVDGRTGNRATKNRLTGRAALRRAFWPWRVALHVKRSDAQAPKDKSMLSHNPKHAWWTT